MWQAPPRSGKSRHTRYPNYKPRTGQECCVSDTNYGAREDFLYPVLERCVCDRYAPAMPDTPTLLSVNDLAKALQVSERTIWRLIKEGTLPHLRVRGQYRFDLAEVREALRGDEGAA